MKLENLDNRKTQQKGETNKGNPSQTRTITIGDNNKTSTRY